MTSNDNRTPWYKDDSQRRNVFFILAVLTLAGIVRLYACLNDFWFDEIWSADIFARNFDSVWQWLTTGDATLKADFQHDNNHYFNTWLIYLIGPDRHWIYFRLPAVVAGVGTIALSGMIAKRWGTVEATAALLITSTSFLLIQYSSEARGYAYVLLFVAASIELIYRGLERDRWWIDITLGVVAMLGFVSHLTYIYCFFPLIAWSAWSLVQQRVSLRGFVLRMCRWYSVPSLFLVWFYANLLHDIEIGGADPSDTMLVVLQTSSLTVGGPEAGTLSILLAFAVVGILAWGLLVAASGKDQFWVLPLFGIVLMPALVMLVLRPDFLFPRYFLVCVFMAQLLFCGLVGHVFRKYKLGKPIVVVSLAAYFIGNAVHTTGLLQTGRGQYQAAIAYMDEQTASGVITIGSGSKVVDREGLIVRFYGHRNLPLGRHKFFRVRDYPPGGPQWILTHRFDHGFTPSAKYQDPYGNIYHFEEVFPYSGLSGWHCLLYRNDDVLANAPKM